MKSAFHSKSGAGELENAFKKVLIVYSSGSIGANLDMVIDKGYLKDMMRKNIFLCDYNRTFSQDDFSCSQE